MSDYPATFVDDSGETRLAGTLKMDGNSTGNFSSATITTGGVTAIVAATGINVGGASDKLGFYGHAPTLLQTGVAVSAAGIHAALVNLGLITA